MGPKLSGNVVCHSTSFSMLGMPFTLLEIHTGSTNTDTTFNTSATKTTNSFKDCQKSREVGTLIDWPLPQN